MLGKPVRNFLIKTIVTTFFSVEILNENLVVNELGKIWSLKFLVLIRLFTGSNARKKLSLPLKIS